MRTEYRVIFTSIFDTVEERDKAYVSLKTQIVDTVSKTAIFKRADLARDEYQLNDPQVTERLV